MRKRSREPNDVNQSGLKRTRSGAINVLVSLQCSEQKTTPKESLMLFTQNVLTNIQENKQVYLTEFMSNYLFINNNAIIIYKDALELFLEHFNFHTKAHTLPYMAPYILSINDDDSKNIPKIYVSNLVNKSDSKNIDYFKSIISSVDSFTFKDLKAFFRTHVYDKEISGIQNQHDSIYRTKRYKYSRQLMNLLELPENQTYTHNYLLNKYTNYLSNYMNENNIVCEPNYIIVNDKFAEIFNINIKKILKSKAYDIFLMHIMDENTNYICQTKSVNNVSYMEAEYYTSKSTNKLNGFFRKYYPNGKVSLESYYCEGKIHGIQRTWYENGNIRSVSYYFNNIPNRVCTYINQNGEIITRSEYIFGHLINVKNAF